MTTSQAAAIWPVMKAFSEGKKVQGRCLESVVGANVWTTTDEPNFYPTFEWRIKPELFEGKFIIWPNGIAQHSPIEGCHTAEYLEVKGARIVTLREVEEQ
jgi:hypothetical protein